MNRIDRLLGIILLLQSKRITRASEIAKYFGKSKRTIYRDIEALSEAGVPLSAEPGEGYSIIEGYYLPPVMFTPEEASALLLGTEFVEKRADSAYRGNARSAMLKIKSILKSDTKEYINKINKSTLIFNRNTTDKNVLQNIQKSSANNSIIHIKYFSLSKNEITDRTIEPMGLIYYGENWRIIAYCRLRKDFREFRINRIKSIKFDNEKFKPRKNFSLEDFVSQEYKIKNPIEVKIFFDKITTRMIKEKYSQGLIKEESQKNGSLLTFIYSKERIDDIANWLLSFHTKAKIISPLDLQDLIIKKTEDLLNIYDSGPKNTKSIISCN